jgi:GNAT superfamily N-acetyltransferase
VKHKNDNNRLSVRPLLEADLDEADRIMRLAFGTYTEQPDPRQYKGDAGLVRPRWRADPASAFAAEIDGRLVGSNFAAQWGSFGFLGPLSIDPAYWDRGFAKYLVAPTVELLDSWGVKLAGLFTFPHSVKHIGLYQRFGFRPRCLTMVFEKAVDPKAQASLSWSVLSQLDDGQRRKALQACRQLTGMIYEGLDVILEIESITAQDLGDTVLVWGENGLIGFAACHAGPGTEAGSGACFVKFGAAAPGHNVRDSFKKLLLSCEAFAKHVHADRIMLGVNSARQEAYEAILSAGYQMLRTGIAMHRPHLAGFSKSGDFVIDDLR